MPFWKRTQKEAPALDARSRIAELAQRAQEALERGDLAEMGELVDEGFGLADQHGIKDDVCFVCLALVSGDGAFAMDDAESAAAMYKTAEDVLVKLGGPGGGDDTESTLSLLARARVGLAGADVARGYDDRAIERFRSALELIARLDSAVPPEYVAAIESELSRLTAT